jgi:uncharacterized protein (TIGR02597 family)
MRKFKARKVTPMKHQLATVTISLVTGLALFGQVQAQGETTKPVGFTSVNSLANSDTLYSVPLTRASEFDGTVQSVASGTITVAQSPNWATNQFVYVPVSQPKTYYVLIGGGGTSNPREGHIFTITANGSNTLTVDTSADDLTGITANTQLSVIPFWTMATMFPPSKAGVYFTATTSTTSYKTQVLVPDNTASGINLPMTTYFFSNNVNGTTGNVGWRIVGDNFTDHGDDPLLPDSYVNIRNLHGSPTLTFRGFGHVVTGKVATALQTLTTGQQDNAVSMIRPIGVSLNQTGLSPADGSFVATTRPRQVKDQLLIFNNAQVKHNKKPSAIYYYSGANPMGWRLAGGGTVDHGNDVIPAGSAIIIRKATTTNGATVFWTNPPTY